MLEIPREIMERLERHATYLARMAEMGRYVYEKGDYYSEDLINKALTHAVMHLGALRELEELFPEAGLEEKLRKKFPKLPLGD
jgi:hypothetical protein